MTVEQLGAIAGVILSLLFSYVPGLSDWFSALPATTKRLIRDEPEIFRPRSRASATIYLYSRESSSRRAR